MTEEMYSAVWNKFITTGTEVSSKYEKMLKHSAAKVGMCSCEIESLVCLYNIGKPCTVKYISDSVHYSKGMVSRCIDSLQNDGYVTVVRDDVDRRAVRVSLTEKGKPMLQAIDEERVAMTKKLYNGLSESELRQFEHVLSAVFENTKRNMMAR